jgi:hypothetical protein
LLFGATLLLLRRVRLRAQTIPSLVWAADLVTMLQVSFLAFFVAGAALSMAYYDLVYLFVGISLTLDRIVREHKRDPTVDGLVLDTRSKWRATAAHDAAQVHALEI